MVVDILVVCGHDKMCVMDPKEAIITSVAVNNLPISTLNLNQLHQGFGLRKRVDKFSQIIQKIQDITLHRLGRNVAHTIST